jgi:AraC-like DNA-binding protein
MQQLVDCIDAHLKLPPTLSAMALVAALSPSHFAKNFRLSTGLSLQRFVNRRRILASLEMLKDQPQPLATSPSTQASPRRAISRGSSARPPA